MFPKLAAELIGTFWLVLGGCGSAVLAAAFPDVGIGLLGVSLAFGLTVLTGRLRARSDLGRSLQSGRLGRPVGGRPLSRRPRCCLTSWRRWSAASSAPACSTSSRAAARISALPAGFASNGYGAHSPGGYSLVAALVCEVVMTFMFLIVILGATHKRAPVGFAGLAIGLALTLIHLISIPVTNTSVNPARSTATALFVGGWALQQLWLFWVAPVIGAALAGVVHTCGPRRPVEEPPVTGRVASHAHA